MYTEYVHHSSSSGLYNANILLGRGEFDLEVLLYYGSGSFCDSSYSMKFKNINIGILHEIIHSINLFNLIYIHTIVNIL